MSSAGAATPNPLVTVLGDAAIDLLPSGGTQHIDFPVTVTSGVSGVTARAVDAEYGQTKPQDLRAAVTARYLGPTTGRLAEIQLTVPSIVVARQGTYTVTVAVEATRPTNATAQLLQLQIVRPAAALHAQQQIDITRTRTWGFLGATTKISSPLILRETADRSALTELALTSEHATSGGHVAIAGSLPAEVSAGGTVEIPLRAVGDFRLGETTGTVEVSAPQLAAPFTAAYRVTERRDPRIIPILALIGVLFGWVTRVWLAQVIALGRARGQGTALLGQMRALRNQYPDATLKLAIDGAAAALTAATKKADVKTLNDAISTAQDALQKARADYTTMQTAAAQQVEALLATTQRQWSAPAAIRAALARAATDARRAEDARATGNPTNAAQIARDADSQMKADVAAAAAEWRTNLLAATGAFAEPPAPAPLRAAAAQADAAVQAAALTTDDSADTVAVLQAIHRARLQLADALASELPRLRAAARAAAAAVRANAGLDPGPADALEQAADALPDPAARDAEVLVGHVGPAAARLAAAAAAALVEPLVDQGTAHDQAAADVDAGNYAAAAAIVVEKLPRDTSGVNLRGAGAVAAFAPPPTLADTTASAMTAAAAAPEVLAVAPGRPLDLPVGFAATNERRTRAAIALQTAIVAALAIVVAIVLFDVNWTGNAQDLLKVGLWGFTLNLTADALVAAARGPGQPVAGG